MTDHAEKKTMTPKEFNKGMGQVVRQLRKERGFNQSVLADALGVSYQQIQKGEHGVNAFSAFQLCKLAALFGAPVQYIYERAGVPMGADEPTPAENDSFLAARYVAKIADPKLRSSVVDFTRKLAYQGGAAA